MNFQYYFWPEEHFPWTHCSGANAKSTLVLSSGSEVAQSLPFLKKILRAVDLDFDQDIHFLSTSADLQIQLLSVPQFDAYEKLLLFGLKPSQIGILSGDHAGCQVFQFERLTCVSAPALAEIEAQAVQKKQLWVALKQVFKNHDRDEA